MAGKDGDGVKIQRFLQKDKEKTEQARQWYREHQEPGMAKKMKFLTYGIIAFETLFIVLCILNVFSPRIWCIVTLLLTPVPIFLTIKYPAYFSFIYGSKYDKIPVNSALGILFFSAGYGAAGSMMSFALYDWKSVLLPLVCFLMIAVFVLWLCIRMSDESVAKIVKSECITIAIVLVLFGFGSVLQLNHLLSAEPPEYHPAMVQSVRKGTGTGRSGTGSAVYVILHTGERKQIYVHTSLRNCAVGNTIMLEHRKGGLGVDYILALRDKPLIG